MAFYRFTPLHSDVSGLESVTVAADGATITFDLSKSNVHQVTLGANRTLAVKNGKAGRRFQLRIVQDATGSRTVTWFATIRWAGGSAPTLTTTAAQADVFEFIQTGPATFDGFILGQNV